MAKFFVGNSDSACLFLEQSEFKVQKIFYARTPSDSLNNFAEKNRIPLCPLDELKPNESDVIVLYECHRIFSAQELSRGRWINIHAGILPYWRGYNANSWAILSDFPTIGISIHEVTAELDAGPIIKVYSIDNDQTTSYFEFKQTLMEQVMIDFDNLVKDYVSGKLTLHPQRVNPNEIRYCSRLKTEDGIIESFDRKSKDLFNLFRIFSRTNESDFFLKLNDVLFRVLTVRIVPIVYTGPPGRLLLRDENRCLIKTKDGAVWCTFEATDLEKLIKVMR